MKFKSRIKIFFMIEGFVLFQGILVLQRPSIFHIFILPLGFALGFFMSELKESSQK